MSIHAINRNFLVNSLGIIVQRLATLVLVAIYTRSMSKNEFGLYSLVLLFIFILSPLVISTVTGAVQRFYVEYSGIERDQCIGNVAFVLFGVGVVILGLLTAFGNEFVDFIFVSGEVTYYPYIFLAQFCVIPFLLVSLHGAVFQSEGNPFMAAKIQIILAGALVVSGGYLVHIQEGGVVEAISALLISLWIIVPFMLRDLIGKVRLKFNKKQFFLILAFSLPLVPYTLLTLFKDSVDRLLIERFLGFPDLGVYAVSLMLASSVGLVVSSYGNALSPLMYRIFKDLGKVQGGQFLEKRVVSGAAFVFFVFIGVSIFSDEIVYLVAGDAYMKASDVMPYLCFGFVVRYFWLMSYYKILFEKQTKILPVISFFGLLVTAVSAFFLLDEVGILGAAYAFIMGYVIMASLGVIFSKMYGFSVYPLIKLFAMGGVFSWLVIITSDLMLLPVMENVSFLAVKLIIMLFSMIFLHVYCSLPMPSVISRFLLRK